MGVTLQNNNRLKQISSIELQQALEDLILIKMQHPNRAVTECQTPLAPMYHLITPGHENENQIILMVCIYSCHDKLSPKANRQGNVPCAVSLFQVACL